MQPEAEAALSAVLDQELDLARAMAELLARERAALSGDSPDAVITSAADKSRLAERFEACERRRQALILAAGIDADQDPRRADLPASVAQRWSALLAVAAECRNANEVNGYIVHSRQHQVRQLIDALRGGTPATYGASGRVASASLRAIAQA
ncbi:MAG: flagellar protein FlgN [Gammaproteobacteria bacterium]|nr:flagellar protein FlgN [Gammaproteobacteria bacterium]